MAGASGARSATVLADIGSTFIKLVGVGADGSLLGGRTVPTTHQDIGAGVERAHAALAVEWELEPRVADLILSSSAGGGLRVVVLGFERDLTVKAGLRASATAGARIVGVYTDAELAIESADRFNARAPDLALLTGGTDGGDEQSIVRNAQALARLAPDLPVVVAGNEAASADVRRALGNGRPVEFVDNVMPRVGELSSEPAQLAIRRIFIERVIGRGRFASASAIAGAVRMPTPAAVLAGAEVVAALGVSRTPFAAPVVVDVGGATTDVHSVIADGEASRAYGAAGLPDQILTRTVEGDLGLRENAEALVEAAIADGYAQDAVEEDLLRGAAQRRRLDREYLPVDELDARVDERLAELATAIALIRHAGVLRTSLTPAGAVLRRTGRDLRAASCLIVTGGIYRHSRRATEIAASALREARRRGGLLAAELPIFRDRSYLLWAAGLLWAERPEAATRIVEHTLLDGTTPR